MYYSPQKHIRYSFQKRRRKADAKLPCILTIIALSLFGGLFLMQRDALKITRISVEGNDASLAKEIQSSLSLRTIYFFSSLKHIQKELLASHPKLQTLSLRLNLPKRTLTASYISRTPHFLWCKNKNGNCYLIDKNGVIFERSDMTQSTLLTKIEDDYFDITKTGTKIPPLYITSLLSIEDALKEKTIAINSIRIEAPFSLKTIIYSHIELRFTVQKDIDNQLKTLAVFLSSLTPEKFSALSYIDLRVKNRIYYK